MKSLLHIIKYDLPGMKGEFNTGFGDLYLKEAFITFNILVLVQHPIYILYFHISQLAERRHYSFLAQ